MIQRWIDFWNRREAPTTLALVRILVATALVADLMLAYALGVVDAVWAAPPRGMGYGALAHDGPALVRIFGTSDGVAHAAWWGALLSISLVGVGLFTRIAAIAFVFFSAQLAHIAPDADRGVDMLLRIVVAVLACSGCNARWSFDAWIRRRVTGRSTATVSAWPRYLIFAQLVWMYFSAGINKADRGWGFEGDFAALASVLSDPHFARYSSQWIATWFPLTQLATFATMAFELGAPIFLLACVLASTLSRPQVAKAARRLRYAWLVAGLGFHLGIAATMRLGMFPFGVLAVWPVFITPEGLTAGWNRLRRRHQGSVHVETSATI